MLPATRRPVCCTITGTTALSRSAASRRAWHTISMGTASGHGHRGRRLRRRWFSRYRKDQFLRRFPSLYKNDDGKFFTDVSQQAGPGTRINSSAGASPLSTSMTTAGAIWLSPTATSIRKWTASPIGDTLSAEDPALSQSRQWPICGYHRDGGPGACSRPSGTRPGRRRSRWRRPPGNRHREHERPPSLLKNAGPRQNYLSRDAGRDAIEPQRHRRAGHCEAERRRQIDEVMSGGSYYSQNDLTLYFGLGRPRRRLASRCAGRTAKSRSSRISRSTRSC